MITEKKQLFDLSYLNLIEDKGLIAAVINLYLEETQLDLLKMKIALNKSHFEIIRATVDKMKISTGMIQADRLYSVLDEIDTIAKYGGAYSNLYKLEYFARYEFDQLKYELELYLTDLHRIMRHQREMDSQSSTQNYISCR